MHPRRPGAGRHRRGDLSDFATSTYVQPRLGENKGYEYARTKNRPAACWGEPGRSSAGHGHCFASGMSAIDVVFRMLRSGDHVIAGENMYGGSYRLFNRVLEKFGLQFTYVDTSRVEAVRDAIRPNTKILYLETPTNPMMTLTDIAACAEVAHKRGALVVVDNTFCSPYLQRPIELGADIVLHSTTKFLNGHPIRRRRGDLERRRSRSRSASCRTRSARFFRPGTPGSCCAA
jgi:cystathionine beta-lyase/cystathionine gamma-synthase